MANKVGHSLVLFVCNKCIYFTQKYGPRDVKLNHEEFILKLVEYLLEEGLKTRVIGTPPERIVRGWLEIFQQVTISLYRSQGKRGLRESLVGLVLLAMDHGKTCKKGDCQRDVPESGAKFTKKFYV